MENKPRIDKKTLTLDTAIEDFYAYFFQEYYSKPYPNEDINHGIARFYHGTLHASRAAIYVPVFANLYRKYQDKEALSLPDTDIKLVQIAALLHDVGRQAEGVDYWDKDSGLIVYHFLIELGVDKEKATLLAEAVANKDGEDEYFSLLIDEKNDKHEWLSLGKCPKNIYQRLIHDADCLDIIRVRDHFDASYLDFYKTIARKNNKAFDEMALFIREARSLIEMEGDSYNRVSLAKKKQYEFEGNYHLILEEINKSNHHYLIPNLYTPTQFLSFEALNKINKNEPAFDAKREWNDENIQAAFREGKIFARSIVTPSAIALTDRKDSRGRMIEETLAALELRKTQRRPGVPTTSSKLDRDKKKGNPHRSVSLIGYGAGVFSCAGFLIFNPDLHAIEGIAAKNSGSGYGKKKDISDSFASVEEKEKELQALIKHLKMGGSTSNLSDYFATHVEIIYHLENYDAIYFTQDPNLGNVYTHGYPDPFHAFSPFLQALHLQKEYERVFGKKLPIFEYSGIHHFLNPVQENKCLDDQIIFMWGEMCKSYLSHQDVKTLKQYSGKLLEEIKIRAMYGDKGGSFISESLGSGDSNYPFVLREKVSQRVNEEIEKALIYHLSHSHNKSMSGELIYEIYKSAPYFKNKLDWIKQIVQYDSDLFFEILNSFLFSDEIFKFLFKLGFDWLKKVIIHPKQLTMLLEMLEGDERQLIKKALGIKEEKDAIQSALLMAIKENNHQDVLSLLSQGASPNEVLSNGFFPIHIASMTGDVQLVQILLNHGAKLYAENQFGETALHWAAWLGQVEMVKFLIRQGFNVNQITLNNKTALQGAVNFAYQEVVSLLIAAGATPSTLNNITPERLFYRWVREGQLDNIKKMLVDFKPDYPTLLQAFKSLNVKDPLDCITFKYLLSEFDGFLPSINVSDLSFIFNIIKDNSSLLEPLIANGLLKDKTKSALLIQMAAKEHHHELLSLLIKKGANVDTAILANLKNTLLHMQPKDQSFYLEKMFKSFARNFISHSCFDELLFFFQKMNEINLPTGAALSFLTPKSLQANMDFFEKLLNTTPSPEWLTKEKRFTLMDFYDQLKDVYLNSKNHKMGLFALPGQREEGGMKPSGFNCLLS